MRLTFHVRMFTVTVIVRKTSKKAKAHKSKKSNRHSA